MENKTDLFFDTPKTESFFRDCMEHSSLVRVDMMPDISWRRLLSDKPIQWMFENFDQLRETVFVQRNHSLDYEKEKWRDKQAHVEAGFTIRINNIDYMVLMEIDTDYLLYFIDQYQLHQL